MIREPETMIIQSNKGVIHMGDGFIQALKGTIRAGENF